MFVYIEGHFCFIFCLHVYVIILCPGSAKELQPEWPSAGHFKRDKLREGEDCK